jgi:hypothetical protein
MAENKKSFIAYADWKETFNALPDDKAGQLIKHLFAYVNDENPKTDDVLINAVFANIKTTLKRDLRKYQTIREKRSMAGKISADKRQHMLTHDNTSKHNSTNSTVSDNDSDSDNDIKKESIKKSLLKADFEKFRSQYPGTKRGIEVEFENLQRKHKDWKDIIPILPDKLKYQKSAREIKRLAGKFVPEWKNLQTWINQRCWEEEITIEPNRDTTENPTVYIPRNVITPDSK